MQMLIIDSHPERLITTANVSGLASNHPSLQQYLKEYAHTLFVNHGTEKQEKESKN